MPTTPRDRARAQTMEEITRLGREHLAVHGAAGLSLRAVARDLGLVSSAVYRYVKSRDDLLTLLVVDAYTELGDQVDAAVAVVDRADHGGRFRALARAVREWALREPAGYALLFGSPVPGYDAPADQTTGPGTRVVTALVRIFDDAHRAGVLSPPGAAGLPADLSADVHRIREEMGLAMPEEVIATGVLVWAALFGVVNFEAFGQYGPHTFSAPDQLFEHHLTVLEAAIGLG
ncbi:TetR-like C-terminal domain-containing protein [Arthrobacter sp. H5]|uniref:TetR/AcrR family transcriptional regulator n=1 Tax=Arthrobacter sp. H5 TaxID=1267973 RepID=UPI0004892D66|nr:TetR-like C-terminal domain-containing protein [Arthrobacter sp. H5]